MKQISLFFAIILYLPNLALAMSEHKLDAAAEDICKCGIPPGSSCFDNLEKKYPEIAKSEKLQNRVMEMAKNKCLNYLGAMSRGNLNAGTDSVQAMVGNPNLDLSKLPPNVAAALKGVNKVVSSTKDCSTRDFKVDIPSNWRCRKQDKNPLDVTLYTDGNTLNVSLGINQGRTSCSVIPNCESKGYKLSNKFYTTRTRIKTS